MCVVVADNHPELQPEHRHTSHDTGGRRELKLRDVFVLSEFVLLPTQTETFSELLAPHLAFLLLIPFVIWTKHTWC